MENSTNNEIKKKSSIMINNTSINNNAENINKKTKKVMWDEEKLAEQELERKLNPKMKINDPKTPYTEIADDETDNYLLKLKEVNNENDETVIININYKLFFNILKNINLKKAIEKLNDINKENMDIKNLEDNELNEEERKKKFKEKQKKAYENEFVLAKQKNKELELLDEELLDETIANTKINKVIGKLTK